MIADQTTLVAQIKADLISRGIDLSGPDGAFQITKRVAWALRNVGGGLLSKPSGNNSGGYSVDYVVIANEGGYDMLGDSGGANTPGWDGPDATLIGRWMPAIDPGDQVSTANTSGAGSMPGSTPVTLADLESAIAQINAHADANTEKIQQQIDQVVKNAETSFSGALGSVGGTAALGGLLKAFGK